MWKSLTVTQQCIVMSMSVCLSVCLSAHVPLKPHVQTTPYFLSTICYLLQWLGHPLVALQCLVPLVLPAPCIVRVHEM